MRFFDTVYYHRRSNNLCSAVRSGCNMAGHRRNGISVRRTCLDIAPFIRASIVGSPNLGRIIHHARIKTTPAAGTSFELNSIHSLYESGNKIVNA